MIRRVQALFLFLVFLVGAWFWFSFTENQTASVGLNPIAPQPRLAVQLPGPRQAGLVLAGVASAPSRNDGSHYLATADQHIKSTAQDHSLREDHELRGVVSQSPIGATVTYDVYQGNLPIVGMRIEVRLDANGVVTGSNWNYRPIDTVRVDESGPALYEETANRMPSGFHVRRDGTQFSEVIFEIPDQGRGEHSVVVPAINQFQAPVSLILRASDGALLSVEMPRYEIDRQTHR